MQYFDGNAARSEGDATPAPVQLQPLLQFFSLREQPFAPTADPVYYYATSSHRECLFHLWNTIDERHGIAVVLGSYGSGKTTLLRKLMTGMRSNPERYNTTIIASPIPSWTSFSLLEAITTQFGLKPEARSFVAYMESLYAYLLTKRESITTLIIDDAQNLNKRGQMELLRLVQNLETPQHKLINLVFFAQLEWLNVLRAAPNFEQRVNATYTLEPLTEHDTKNLIAFRLREAGMREAGPVFDDSAIRLIHAFSEGSPRVTVTLCRNALVLAYQLRTRRIGQAIILHTIQKTTTPDSAKRQRVADLLTSQKRAEVIRTPDPVEAVESEVDVLAADAASEHRVRANQLLLRVARVNMHRGASAEFDDNNL